LETRAWNLDVNNLWIPDRSEVGASGMTEILGYEGAAERPPFFCCAAWSADRPSLLCEPTGRANARPMTGSAKQSIAIRKRIGLLRRSRSSQWRRGERAPAHPIAPRCTPDGSGKVPCTGTFQISWAYSRMVRSDENHGIRATLRIEARVHAGTTCQRVSMPRCAS